MTIFIRQSLLGLRSRRHIFQEPRAPVLRYLDRRRISNEKFGNDSQTKLGRQYAQMARQRDSRDEVRVPGISATPRDTAPKRVRRDKPNRRRPPPEVVRP